MKLLTFLLLVLSFSCAQEEKKPAQLGPIVLPVTAVDGHSKASISFIKDDEGVNHIITSYHVCEGLPALYSEQHKKFFFLKVVKLSRAMHLCELEGRVEQADYLNLSKNESDSGVAHGFPGPDFKYTRVPLKYRQSGLGRLYMDVITPFGAYSGMLRGGMSGGPTINKNREVIGINTASSAMPGVNISLLVTANTIRDFLQYSGDKVVLNPLEALKNMLNRHTLPYGTFNVK